MPTQKHNQTPAEFCREMGWGVGQRLVGDEGYGPTTIEITAIGEDKLLAKAIHPKPRSENNWTLCCRDWQPVQ